MRRRHRWLALLVVALAPGLAGVAGGATEEPRGYEQVIDLTFPVAGPATYSNDYHANRGDGTRRHQATDVFADKLQRVHAAVGGTVVRITGIDEPMPSYGYQIVIRGDDGREYGYVHLNNDSPGTDDGQGGPEWAYAAGIRKGSTVERGQWIGYIGDSGNAETTPPHLHFSIYDPELEDPRLATEPYVQGRMNPYHSLEAARVRGDMPAAPAGAPSPSSDASGEDSGAGEQPPADAEVRRVAGRTRVQTAVALAQARGDRPRTVVIAPSTTHANALVAAPLAGLVDAPVLLTAASGLEEVVAAEVRRLGAVNAYVVGDTAQLTEQVVDDLRVAGVQNVARLTGADRYALSATVAREILSYPWVEALPEVLLALGDAQEESRAWPDALSASALAAHASTPILLTRPDRLPDPVAEVLRELRPELVRAVGGEAAISAAVADAAASAAGAALERLAGRTRYETSIAVAEAGIAAGLDADAVWLATGRNYPDALAAGPAAARDRAPLLLVDGADLRGSPQSAAWLEGTAASVRAAVVVGGPAAISEAVAADVAQRLRR